jgi:hypothetical protein
MTYVAINLLTFIIKLVSFGRIVPADEDLKEYWTCKSHNIQHYLFVSPVLMPYFSIREIS